MKPITLVLCLSLFFAFVFLSFFLSITKGQTSNPCARNEIYLECGPPCDYECTKKGVACNVTAHTRCTPGCFCTEKHARNVNHNCVRDEYCNVDYLKDFIPFPNA